MRLRVLDFGTVPALRSQAVYHGLAEAMTPEADAVLSLVSPETPYVCVGLHQDIEKEVDTGFCAANGLPVWRRHVGGGAVYLDRDQLFTHFVFPAGKAPSRADQLYPLFIEPVVRTYREMGIAAAYRPINDIQVNGRKIGGTGAASIGGATVMVGSFLMDFDTATMAKCLKVPSEKFRDKLRQTLDDYMTTMVKELGRRPDRDAVKAMFLRHCHDVLGIPVIEDAPTAAELAAIARAEADLADPGFIDAQHRKLVALGVKISADTHLTEAARKAPGGLVRVTLLEREGRIADLVITGDFTCLPPDGMDRLAERLKGVALERTALEAAAAQAIAELGLDLPGITAADLAETLMMAVHPG
ncbi:MAG: lipoate--protein ligase family protein [Rhodobacteraceae bacterium]|nr:lipoate--protein ligase family protein [Paracoccaceae bacterium]